MDKMRGDNGQPPDKNGSSGRMNRILRTASFWALLVLIPVAILQLMNSARGQQEALDYTEFRAELEAGNIQSVTISEGVSVEGRLKRPIQREETQIDRFQTRLPTELSEELEAELRAQNVQIEARPAGNNWVNILVGILPWVLIIGLWLFVFRQMQAGGSRAFSFGKSKARLLSGDTPKVTFADVAGCDEAKDELQEIIEFLKDPQKFSRLGGRLPKGALLVGPPGTGKTLLARAVAGEADRPFFSMSGSDFVEMFVGVGASVTGDTPVLVRDDEGTRLVTIGEYVDGVYDSLGVARGEERHDRVMPVFGTETLGYESGETGFRGDLDVFGASAWRSVKGVYRHRVDEIYGVEYLGGTIRTTGDHSVFVRGHGGIRPIAVRDLEPGDVLVNLPYHVRGGFDPEHGTKREARAHAFECTTAPAFLTVDPPDDEARAAYTFAVGAADFHSQRTLGDVLGVSQMTISNWQRGVHKPRAISDRYATTEIPEEVEVTPGLLRLLGLYAAEGRANSALEFVFGAHETTLIDECDALMGRHFGLRASCETTGDNTVRLHYRSAALGRFFARQCGTGSHEKHVPALLWDAPRELFLPFLDGWSDGDGYTSREGKLCVTSVSRRLVEEVAWLCAMHGISTGIRHGEQPEGRFLKGRSLPGGEYWTLIIGKTSNPFGDSAEETTPGQAKRSVVRRVVRKPYDGYVYDLCGCENEAFFGGSKPVLLHNSRVRDLFEQGKAHAPCIIFIDEIDAVGRHRGAGLGGGHDEREQTLNQLLVEMDGFESNEGVILLAATNRPDVLDPALLRPGRFDRQIVVDNPDVKGREGIFRVHTQDIPLAEDVNLAVLAKGTPGLSGADIENVVNEAALLAARENKDRVYMDEFERAKDKVMLGTERRSMVISDEERKVTAYHEAGHAVIALRVPGLDPLHKVTIVPRGRALGITASLPEEDRHNYTKDWLEGQLKMMFGGRVAEEMTFGEGKITTGAGNDIERATDLARRMVTQFGMSPAIGPMAVGDREQEVFLGRDISHRREVSGKTAELVDAEIKRILDESYESTRQVLEQNSDLLERIAEALLERETLDVDDIGLLEQGKPLPPADIPMPASSLEGKKKKETKTPVERPIEGAGGEPAPAPA